MTLSADQLRLALQELNGQRDLHIEFDAAEPCIVKGALLVPAEADGLVKVTDGTRVFLVDSERIAWIEIGSLDRLTTTQPHAHSGR
jgi:hypothetical protein